MGLASSLPCLAMSCESVVLPMVLPQDGECGGWEVQEASASRIRYPNNVPSGERPATPSRASGFPQARVMGIRAVCREWPLSVSRLLLPP